MAYTYRHLHHLLLSNNEGKVPLLEYIAKRIPLIALK